MVGRGSRIHFLLGKHFHRKHLSDVSRGSAGSGISQAGSASLLLSRVKAAGFLLPILTLSVLRPTFSQPAELQGRRTDPRTPQVRSTLFNKQGFCQPEPCNEADCPHPSRRNADKEMSGKSLKQIKPHSSSGAGLGL